MLRRVSALRVVWTSVVVGLCVAPSAQAQAPVAPVPTSKKVITTPPPPAAASPVAGTPASPPAAAPPTTTAAAPPPAPPPAQAPATAPAPGTVEKARQGVVVIERQGRPLALGAVLDGDGRVITALSPLGNGNFLNARYADGTVAPLRLIHSDRGWDLALLSANPTPPQAPYKTGLKAAKTPSFTGLQTFNASPKGPVTLPTALKLASNLLGGDALTISGAYEITGAPPLVGGPVVNPEGEVVALIARACSGGAKPGCVPAPYAAPVSALKRFLQRIPAQATWLGIEGASEESASIRGVRVVSVAPSSPASVGGLRPGPSPLQADLIVAVDGAPVATPHDLNEAVRARTTGDEVELLLFGLGRYRHVRVKPAAAPELVAPPYVAPPKAPKVGTPNPYR